MATLDLRRRKNGTVDALILSDCTLAETQQVQSLPQARPNTGYTSFPPDPLLAVRLSTLLPLSISLDAQGWLAGTEMRLRSFVSLKEHPDCDLLTLSPTIAHNMRAYQRVGAFALAQQKRALLADEMGTGKTMQSLIAAELTGARRILIVTLASAKRQWQGEVRRWLCREAVVVDGSPKARLALINSNPDIVIINYEILREAQDVIKKGKVARVGKYPKLGRRWDAVIFDEAQRLQNKDAQQSKAARPLAAQTPVVFLLSGTPMWRMPDSLWHLLHLLDPERFSAYWPHVEEYCVTRVNAWSGTTDVVGLKPERKEDHARILAEYMLRRTKEQVTPELPQKIFHLHTYTLSDAQEAHYRSIAEKLKLAYATPQYLSSRGAMLVSLRRLCNAPKLLGLALPSPKDAALLELVESVLAESRKTCILCWHTDYVAYLYQLLLKKKYHVTNADVPSLRRTKIVEAFKEDDSQILLGTIGALGTAINLDVDRHGQKLIDQLIFAELDWVPHNNAQAADRIHRLTTRWPVNIHYLVDDGDRIEQHILDVSQHKGDLASETLAIDEVVRRILASFSEGLDKPKVI